MRKKTPPEDTQEMPEAQLTVKWYDDTASYSYTLSKRVFRHGNFTMEDQIHGSRKWAELIAKHYGIEVPKLPVFTAIIDQSSIDRDAEWLYRDLQRAMSKLQMSAVDAPADTLVLYVPSGYKDNMSIATVTSVKKLFLEALSQKPHADAFYTKAEIKQIIEEL